MGSRIIKYTVSQEAKSREVVLVDVRLVLMTAPVDTYKNRIDKNTISSDQVENIFWRAWLRVPYYAKKSLNQCFLTVIMCLQPVNEQSKQKCVACGLCLNNLFSSAFLLVLPPPGHIQM